MFRNRVAVSICVLSLLLLQACGGSSDHSSVIEIEQMRLEYDSKVVLRSGDTKEIRPIFFNRGQSTDASCTSANVLPPWMTLNPKTCALTVNAVRTGEWGPYEIKLANVVQNTSAKLRLSVSAPNASTLPEPENPAGVHKYYMMTSLSADSNYLAVFDWTSIYFLNASNPYKPDVISSVDMGTLGAGAPQAITSIGSYIYVVTNTGKVTVFDWSQRATPTHVVTASITTGQNYDVADNGKDTLFIANTERNALFVVDVSDPTNPNAVFSDTAISVASGVTYSNGYVYVTSYGSGKIYSYKKNNGTWEKQSEVDSTLVNAIARPYANEGKLVVPKYNGNQAEVYSLNTPATPVYLETLTLPSTISVYTRPVISYSELHLTTAQDGVPAIVSYKIPKNNQALTSISTISPACQGGDCNVFMGLTSFRKASFLAFIGSHTDNGNNRELLTRSLPLKPD